LDGVAFHPYYTVHDLTAIAVFMFVFCGIIFFMPEMGGYFLEHANFEIANGLKTPEHIAPVWYFTPFYSVLRAVPDKLLGFIAFGASVAILFMLPWLDRSKVKSIRYKGNFSKAAILIFVASFLILGVLGVKAPTEARTLLARICSVLYFAFFLLMPFWTKWEATKPVPTRTTDGGMGFWKSMGVLLVVILLTVLPLKAAGSESAFDCGTMACDEIETDVTDMPSLQGGAATYMNFCMGCHSLEYARYQRTAEDLGIPLELFEENLKFDADARIGSLMKNSMAPADAKKWFGAAPPNLTLVARARSPEWLYTYLRNFYVDPSRPYGVNNKVFKDVGMPHVMAELQGMPECAPGPVHAQNGGVLRDPLTGEDVLYGDDGKALNPCGSFTYQSEGALSPAEYDKVVYDLVNFLEYIGEPSATKSKRIGGYALLLISLFFIFAFLLNREYWKDVH
jgi:ubiquinol-cytochrome c reductase cytochrome b subunit